MGVRCARQGRGSRLGGRPGWAAGHPYAAAGARHDGVRGALADGVNQLGATTPNAWGS
jgi:hypothetical protein